MNLENELYDMPECEPSNMDIEELTYWMKSPTDKYGRELARREEQNFRFEAQNEDYYWDAKYGMI